MTAFRAVRVFVPIISATLALLGAGDAWGSPDLSDTASVSHGGNPGWLSVLPTLVAFVLAAALRQVILALFAGVWVGAFLIAGPSASGVFQGMLDAASEHAVGAVADAGHAALVVSTLMLGGMVAVVSRNGGVHGIVQRVTAWANTVRRGQLATFAMGIALFFDDYANTLVVGKTMRPVADALRISRAKLAWLVDCTAAPVATLALISTWIGLQLGLIDAAIRDIPEIDASAYGVFLRSLAYNFYPVLTLCFVATIAVTGRDFGPMRAAELAIARGEASGHAVAQDPDTEPKPEKPARPLNAYVPFAALLAAMLGGLYVTGAAKAGSGAGLAEIIGAADVYTALVWATLTGVVTAGTLSLGQRILSLGETVDAWFAGARSMLYAVVVLVLAWALSGVNSELNTAEFLASRLGDALDARLLPTVVFALAAVTAFATGTSWGTMGILTPLVVPLVWTSTSLQGLAGADHLLYASVSAVLAGAVMGDHASPISDTTILSSAATSCDHLEHVHTQLPYALTVGGIAIVTGLIPTGFGLPWWISFIVGAACVGAVVRWLGRHRTDAEPPMTRSD
ncbi:MAG: Na+/H+ antiporter NhaC family protein [Gammaproteobacteria bacterium]|nr:Na+/H+ antiporter NhaC family protein [Gammaproteobacteria bacterium]